MTSAKLERLRALLDAWEAGALRGDEEGELRGLVREAFVLDEHAAWLEACKAAAAANANGDLLALSLAGAYAHGCYSGLLRRHHAP